MDVEQAIRIVDKTYSDPMNGNNRILNTDGEVPVVQLKGFRDISCIKHGFTTRLGGVSTGIYESLNLGFLVGDEKENVMENYRRLGESMGIDHRRISCPMQVHKANILVATVEDAGDGIVRDHSHFETDAQITNVKNLPLVVYTADCVPIILADPVSRVIGTVHAGWRGTVAGIAAKTVEKMVETFGCLPDNIHAAIGTSIGPENYEVDRTVIEAILECPYVDSSAENIAIGTSSPKSRKTSDGNWNYSELGIDAPISDRKFLDSLSKDVGVFFHTGNISKISSYEIFRTVRIRDRYMLNLWNLNELILINAGLKMGNIYCAKLCTMKNHDLFFSHRYTKGKRGLNMGIIELE